MAGLRGIRDLALHDRRWQLIRYYKLLLSCLNDKSKLIQALLPSAWRPLFGPLYDWPLAVLDATSLDCFRDLIASDNVYPHQVSETYNVFFHKDHRWHYLGGQLSSEMLLFKSYDSTTMDGVARGMKALL